MNKLLTMSNGELSNAVGVTNSKNSKFNAAINKKSGFILADDNTMP